MLFAGPERSADPSGREHLSLGVQPLQESLQSGAIEFPIKWAGLTIAELLVQKQPLLHLFQAREVIWGQDFPLNDRKVDLYLIQLTGMDWRMDQDCLAVGLTQSLHRRLTAVRGAVIYDPEHPIGRAVGLCSHELLDQPAKRLDPGMSLAPAHDLPTSDIPGSQVLQSPSSPVLALDAHGAPWACRQGLVAADPGLDAGLFIRADNVVPAAQRLTLPEASVQVQESPGFLSELRVTGKDPVFITPRLDRVGIEDAPDGAGTNRLAQGRRGSSGQVRRRQPTQRQLGLADRFTGDRFNDRLVARGKKRACARGLLARPRRNRCTPNGAARGARSWDANPRAARLRRWTTSGIRGVEEPIAPFGVGHARSFADGPNFDTARRSQRETSVDQEARGQP